MEPSLAPLGRQPEMVVRLRGDEVERPLLQGRTHYSSYSSRRRALARKVAAPRAESVPHPALGRRKLFSRPGPLRRGTRKALIFQARSGRAGFRRLDLGFAAGLV